jgi:hypothetical protein
MIKASIGLQDLRRKIYLKAKSDKTWRFKTPWLRLEQVESGLVYDTLGLFNDYGVRHYRA